MEPSVRTFFPDLLLHPFLKKISNSWDFPWAARSGNNGAGFLRFFHGFSFGDLQFLSDLKVNILFAIGGDGTLKGANALSNKCQERGIKEKKISFFLPPLIFFCGFFLQAKLSLSLGFRRPLITMCVGWTRWGLSRASQLDPHTLFQTFGFDTAVAMAQDSIMGAHAEAKACNGGIGVVKLMGRESGFIALHAALASGDIPCPLLSPHLLFAGDVNLVLLPEVKFTMAKITELVASRIRDRGHCVIVIAEGAGLDIFVSLSHPPSQFRHFLPFCRSGARSGRGCFRQQAAARCGRRVLQRSQEEPFRPPYPLHSQVEHPSPLRFLMSRPRYLDPSYAIRSSKCANPLFIFLFSDWDMWQKQHLGQHYVSAARPRCGPCGHGWKVSPLNPCEKYSIFDQNGNIQPERTWS